MEKQNCTMGMKISALRKERGMTQSELAEQMNVTDKAVSKWERDLSCPDVGSLPRLAELLGISVDELIQAGQARGRTGKGESLDSIISLVFKAVTVAMGVAVLVLSALNRIEVHAGFTLLGLGLACAGVTLLRSKS